MQVRSVDDALLHVFKLVHFGALRVETLDDCSFGRYKAILQGHASRNPRAATCTNGCVSSRLLPCA
jgi:hypothetical protein